METNWKSRRGLAIFYVCYEKELNLEEKKINVAGDNGGESVAAGSSQREKTLPEQEPLQTERSTTRLTAPKLRERPTPRNPDESCILLVMFGRRPVAIFQTAVTWQRNGRPIGGTDDDDGGRDFRNRSNGPGRMNTNAIKISSFLLFFFFPEFIHAIFFVKIILFVCSTPCPYRAKHKNIGVRIINIGFDKIICGYLVFFLN